MPLPLLEDGRIDPHQIAVRFKSHGNRKGWLQEEEWNHRERALSRKRDWRSSPETLNRTLCAQTGFRARQQTCAKNLPGQWRCCKSATSGVEAPASAMLAAGRFGGISSSSCFKGTRSNVPMMGAS